jgi:large subunit ribosomal protein L15
VDGIGQERQSGRTVMKLHELKAPPGARHRRKRKGMGPGSTLGKTAGRGQKGQYARSTVHRHFEGGQTPLYRRLPRRGFSNANFRQEFRIVNLGDLAVPALRDKQTIGVQELVAAGAIRGGDLPVKVLGDGELKRAITVYADKFSKSAKAKIESAGGQAVAIGAKAAEEKAAGAMAAGAEATGAKK